MLATKIYREDWEVEPRLAQLETSKAEMIEIIRRAVAARNDATDDDPITAPGTLSYIFGVRAVRRTFRKKGWAIYRAENIEATYNSENGIKIVFQNAESAADPLQLPQAVRQKGPASVRAVDIGQGSLFPPDEDEEERSKAQLATVWIIFVHANGDDIRAELSCPRPMVDGIFVSFHERIFIIKPGDWTEIAFKDDDAPDPAQDFEINVTRKH
jgi:hypothetical protein